MRADAASMCATRSYECATESIRCTNAADIGISSASICATPGSNVALASSNDTFVAIDRATAANIDAIARPIRARASCLPASTACAGTFAGCDPPDGPSGCATRRSCRDTAATSSTAAVSQAAGGGSGADSESTRGIATTQSPPPSNRTCARTRPCSAHSRRRSRTVGASSATATVCSAPASLRRSSTRIAREGIHLLGAPPARGLRARDAGASHQRSVVHGGENDHGQIDGAGAG